MRWPSCRFMLLLLHVLGSLLQVGKVGDFYVCRDFVCFLQNLVTRFQKTLLNGKKTKWSVDNTTSFFSPDNSGIVCDYKKILPRALSVLFKSAIDQVKNQYFTTSNHSRDVSSKFYDSSNPIVL